MPSANETAIALVRILVYVVRVLQFATQID